MKITPKMTGTALLAIFIGGVGNGAWEYILEPLFSKGTNLVLSIATLGIESFKNSLYRDIAKGLHESTSLAILSNVNIILFIIFYGAGFFLLASSKKLKKDNKAIQERIEDIENGRHRELESLEKIKNDIAAMKIDNLIKITYITVFLVFLIITSNFISMLTKNYVNRAVTHYLQSKKIVSPYLSEKEILTIDSNFSQIQTPDDYQKVINDLQDVSSQHNLKLPEFTVW